MIANVHIMQVLFKLKEKKDAFFQIPGFTQLMVVAGKDSYCSYLFDMFPSFSVFL